MAFDLKESSEQQFLVSFTGKRKPSREFLDVLRRHSIGGVALFRHKNVGSAAELRELTKSLQRAATQAGRFPLLIAADQEGGQLMAVGDATPFPGNMALGAAGSEQLA